MKELEPLMEELFPENMRPKTLRLKKALIEHFERSLKELSKQGISATEAVDITLTKLGGREKLRKRIKKSNRKYPWLSSPYAILTISLLFGYPLVLWIIFGIFQIGSFPLVLLLPVLFGVAMFASKLYVTVVQIQSNQHDPIHELSNASVLAGAGMRYKGIEEKNTDR